MNSRYFSRISGEMGLTIGQIAAVFSLLDKGATIPFIARYRKEATGSMDEVALAQVRDRLERLGKIDARRVSILKSLNQRELLTDELHDLLKAADSLASLEDIYLPFRRKRRTRADKARESGLLPLAQRILLQEGGDPKEYAEDFLDPDRGIETVPDALSGAGDIIAEKLTEVPETRSTMRSFYWKHGVYESRVIKGMEEIGSKFRDYFDWSEEVRNTPSHRVLAMRRGEEKKVLTLRISVPPESAVDMVLSDWVTDTGSLEGKFIAVAAEDGFRRLLGPSMETETRRRSKELSDDAAIAVFSSNLRKLLLAPPLGSKCIMAIDPGFRTGCKVVCLDPGGALQHNVSIFPFLSLSERRRSEKIILELLQRFEPEFIAVGNGTAGRETEAFLREADLPEGVSVISVNESGASVYSASEAARREFPHLDITVRGAVSIGRRLQDPLAELVKIDPKSIGVGQYQHDVDGRKLQKALEETVESCVNLVGVNVNTASRELLFYVSGLTSRLAGNVVEWREKNGPFLSRRQFMKVPRMGAVAFQQSAGFLRIPGAEDPLDSTAVHPESYGVVRKMAGTLGVSVQKLMASHDMRSTIEPADFQDETIGLPTLLDIMEELDKPGRDPRETFKAFRFAEVYDLKDIEEGMVIPGIVTNVTAFGAFVDIGVHQDGLVHISRMAHRYIRDPAELVSVGDSIRVRVLEIDRKRRRISLSMLITKD